MNDFPQPDFDEPELSGHPMAVLYNDVWWWSVDEMNDILVLERYMDNQTFRVKVHEDDVKEII